VNWKNFVHRLEAATDSREIVMGKIGEQLFLKLRPGASGDYCH